MSDSEPIHFPRGGESAVALDGSEAAPAPVLQTYRPSPPPFTAFDRRELDTILKVYGRMVAAGEWRDYAIDHRKNEAVFSIFRRSSEMPLFRITKTPRLARKQGAYAILSPAGMILKRGRDLKQVMTHFDKKRLEVVL